MSNMGGVTRRAVTFFHLSLLKILHYHKFSFSGVSSISNTSHFTLNDNGRIILGKNVGIRRYCEISASEQGEIVIGNNVFFNNSCMVVCHKKIIIEDGTRFGPGVYIYDHDYNFRELNSFIAGQHYSTEIHLGKNCWIGGNSIILRGTTLGDNCVVGAGSVLKGNYPSNTLIVQKRHEVTSAIRRNNDTESPKE